MRYTFVMPISHGGLIEEQLTSAIIGTFYDVYNELRYGFREHVYSLAMERELVARGHHVCREYQAIVYYKGTELTWERLDMVVDEKVVIESKATEKLGEVASQQLFGYLHATTFEVGLLLHFGPKPGFMRIVASNQFKKFNQR
jgi:GxxExxY protein